MTSGLANITVEEVSFAAEIPAEEIAEVETKIGAIGDVKYDPDVPEDSGELIAPPATLIMLLPRNTEMFLQR